MKKNILARVFSAFLFLFSILFFSCKKYGPAEPTFFLKTSPGLVTVATNTAQGSGSHKITDLWLYVDGLFQGAYPVGNLMPIITRNYNVTIEIFPGIKNNGISDTRIPWNIYQKIKFDTLVPNGAHVERKMTFSYNPDAVFAWMENFDSAVGTSLRESVISDTAYTTFKVVATENAFEGRSLELGLDPTGVVLQVESTNSYILPTGSSNVYLELNYKGNAPFEVGLLGTNSEVKDALIVNPQTNWNKIYIQLSSAVSRDPVSPSYKVYFRLYNNQAYQNVYLDNIKLVYL